MDSNRGSLVLQATAGAASNVQKHFPNNFETLLLKVHSQTYLDNNSSNIAEWFENRQDDVIEM